MKLGRLLANGSSRDVFEHPDNPGLVIKVDLHEQSYNELEWEVWKRVRGTEYEKFFAPCVCFVDGYLIMRRCQPCKETLPSDLVIFGVRIQDSARGANTGLFDNRLVCLDYGHKSVNKLMKAK
jgi:hypothetical protein